jgi:chemotaxis protein methyltransferase CheR
VEYAHTKDEVVGLAPFSIGEPEFRALRTIVESRLGISMPDSKRAMLETRLLRRLRQLNMSTASEYCRYLQSEKGQNQELSKFLDLVTTNKTSFFREQPQLTLLQDKVLPDLLATAARAGRPLRIWSAACSTGQEVWTLVMMVERVLQTLALSAEYTVWGSDVSGQVLQTAIAAKYDHAELAEMDPYYSSRFFMRAKDPSVRVVRVRPEYRKRAGFFHQNLMDEVYKLSQPVDMVLLRNALIYFSRDKQMTIVGQAARHLVPGGLFVVGLTESLHGFPVPFRHCGQSVYQHEVR